MKNQLYILLFIITLIWACEPKGGPCEYDIQKFKAEVMEIKPYGENDYNEEDKQAGKKLYNIMLEFDKSNLSEEMQYLEELRQIKFDTSLIVLNKIKVGIIYTGMVSELSSGNCEPFYLSFNQRFRTE